MEQLPSEQEPKSESCPATPEFAKDCSNEQLIEIIGEMVMEAAWDDSQDWIQGVIMDGHIGLNQMSKAELLDEYHDYRCCMGGELHDDCGCEPKCDCHFKDPHEGGV